MVNFNMLAQYLLQHNKTLFYIDHALYRLDKIKIALKNHCPINAKLYQLTFNYPEFYAMTQFVKNISDYGSTINYDMAHNKTAYKYLLKAFYK